MVPTGVGSSRSKWLFSEHFLAHRLLEWPEFASLDTGDLHRALKELWEAERTTLANAVEGATEDRFIRPVLRLLGHSYSLFAEIPGTGKVPDYLLYAGEAERESAELAGSVAKIERALAVADAKRFDLPLDRRSDEGDPVAQIRNYVALTRKPFGILTNGRIWRLYARDSPLIERACHEVDLAELLENGSADSLRYFVAFFRAEAFRPGVDGRSFLDRALDDSDLHAVEITSRLEEAVFTAVPLVAEGLLGDDARTSALLDKAFANALVFLYRVLFALFAEARELLPVHNPHYRDYSITNHRREVSRLLDTGAQLSSTHGRLFGELGALFRVIDRGDAALGVAEYDGGLFDPTEHPWLEGRTVPDALLAPALNGIYRVDGTYVDYRDLSVRTLGNVYERLLAWELVEAEDGTLTLRESPRRHELGSYFTPEPVVDAIVERTIDPIITRRSNAIQERGLESDAALEELLSLRVLDPAMGSAHFLVGAVGFLAQAIATDPSYDGELSEVELRRLVAERCLYGVDLNPLAVELARLSLWLVTASEGEPLTFLANLRVGDSLVGADNDTLLDPLTGLLEAHIAAAAGSLLHEVQELQARATHTGADAREKKRLADQIQGLREPLAVFAEQAIERFRPPGARPRLHWPLEFPEVFVDERGEPKDEAGFDAVIGNPPYIRVQEIGRDVADYCRARFETPRGSFDAYLVFLERGLSLLAPHGRLGFIVPNKLFKLDFAQKMRTLLSERELVAEVIDFGASQMFSEATNYTCILVLDRGGKRELNYRRIRGSREEVLAELAAVDTLPAQSFTTRALGTDPWMLVPPDEADLIAHASRGADRLDAVTEQIFQGLITSADDVYVLEDRGERAGLKVVYSRASDRELELEQDLLHPLASGSDVERYSFKALGDMLLFPYLSDDGSMRLLNVGELSRLPRTLAYLTEHEQLLRDRESGRMDVDGWYAFGRTQNLAAHDLPKLGVAATVQRLEIAADLDGGVYFHNVRVNGILERAGGASLATLLVLLDSRLLDWIFRRGAAPHANDYYAANKQFIAGLPIRLPDSAADGAALDALGRRLHALAAAAHGERGAFLRWLSATTGVPRATLARRAALAGYETTSTGALVDALARLDTTVDPRARATRELIEAEHARSTDVVLSHVSDLSSADREADALVYELYELPADMRTLVESEYE